MPNKKGQGENLRQFRKDVAALKRAGLLSKRVDARSQKNTRYMREQIRAYKDVLEGHAKAVAIHERDVREMYSAYRQKNRHIVIPIQQADVRVSYSKKEKRVKLRTIMGGQKVTQTIQPVTKEELFPKPSSTETLYQVRFKDNAGTMEFDDWDEFLKHMKGYETIWSSPDSRGRRVRKRKEPLDWVPFLVVTRKEGKSATVDFGTGAYARAKAEAQKQTRSAKGVSGKKTPRSR